MLSVLDQPTHRRVLRGCAISVLMVGTASATFAVDTRFDAKMNGQLKSLLANQEFKPGKAGKAGITVQANFDRFHPEYDSGELTPAMKFVQKYKDANNNDAEKYGVAPATYSIKYPQPENHGSTGVVDYSFGLTKKNNAYFVSVDATGTVAPQKGKNDIISVLASAKDPFSFSDTDSSSFFGSQPDGINYGLGLAAGTSLANSYGPDGGVASDTWISMSGRARLGVFNNGGTFWSGSDGVDLYTLTLTPDASNGVHAALSFETPTSDFSLVYRDYMGNVFDPTDSAAVGMIESYVESQFVGGTLATDLDSVLSVDLVANGGADFSVGQMLEGSAAGIEPVPEPASLAALTIGGLGLFARRRRNV